MPTPKSKSRRASKSPKSATRRAARNLFANDPLLTAMARGNLKWGDLIYTPPSPGSPRSPAMLGAHPPPPSRATLSPASLESTNTVFNDFVTPDLRQRKFIYENFPVVLEEIKSANGAEKYAVKWHRKNLEEWRDTRTSSFAEAMDYMLISELRLLHSLRKYPHLYVIHEPRSADELFVVEMIGDAKRAAAGAGAATAGPVLKKLNDITTHFPGVAVWSKVEGKKGESTYALVIRNDFLKKNEKKIAELVLNNLEAALRASRFWHVLPAAARGEFLRLEMRHD